MVDDNPSDLVMYGMIGDDIVVCEYLAVLIEWQLIINRF